MSSFGTDSDDEDTKPSSPKRYKSRRFKNHNPNSVNRVTDWKQKCKNEEPPDNRGGNYSSYDSSTSSTPSDSKINENDGSNNTSDVSGPSNDDCNESSDCESEREAKTSIHHFRDKFQSDASSDPEKTTSDQIPLLGDDPLLNTDSSDEKICQAVDSDKNDHRQIHCASNENDEGNIDTSRDNFGVDTSPNLVNAAFDANLSHQANSSINVDSSGEGNSRNSDCKSGDNLPDVVDHIDESASENSSSYIDSEDSNVDCGDEIFGGENDHFDRIMFEQSKLTVGDIIMMIKAFSLESGLKDDAQIKLGNMFKICAGPQFANISLTKHTMEKYVPSRNSEIDYHYYCEKCCENVILTVNAGDKIPKQNITCPNESCNSMNSISAKSRSYFTSISLEYQVKKIFGISHVLKNFLDNIKSRKDPSQNDGYPMRDVQDGSLHRNLMVKYKDREFKVATADFNADGAPLNKSGKRSFWPVQLFLNDLSPELRWKHMLLNGILVVEKEPSIALLNLFIKVCLVDQLRELNGKTITFERDGETVIIKFRVLNANLDSPCRGILQNRLLHMACFGCSWCYQRGQWYSELNSVRFPFSQEMVLRTHESHLKDVEKVLEILASNPKFKNLKKKKDVNGVKGLCCLMELEDWDMIWSFCYEYMHGSLLGIMLYILLLLKDPKCPRHLTPKQFEEIERRFLMIRPCQEIHRLPRKKILTGNSKMKASEAKSLALFYFLICFDGIVGEEVIDHFCDFSKSLFSFLEEEISEQGLRVCENDSFRFVRDFENVYNLPPTFNIHTYLHAAESVRRSGPLPMNSTFPPESHIYYLKRFVNGPKDPDKQMAKKHLQSQYFKTGCTQHPQLAQPVRDFINGLFSPDMRSVTAVTNEVCGVSFFDYVGLENIIGIGDCKVYTKCIHKGTVHHSIKYTRAEKTDDTVIQLTSGDYARITDILDSPSKCLLRLSLIETDSSLPFRDVSHIKKVSSLDGRAVIVDIKNVARKILFVDIGFAQYVCTLPNSIEIQ